MLGTASAALIGLLFVVTSIHLSAIVNNPVFHRRANHRTIYLPLLFVESALILMPQSMVALGIEAIAINLYGLVFPIGNVCRYYRVRKHGGATDDFAIVRAVRYIVAFLIGVAGGGPSSSCRRGAFIW